MSDEVIGAIKFYAQNIYGISEDVRLSKRLTLPSKRLRGFETNKVGPQDGSDYIGGNYAAALNFEASLPKLLPESTNTDINIFLDLANLWGVDYDSSLGRSNVLRSSVGVSGNWLSPIGPLSLTFAKDLKKAETDKTNSFNFQLGTSLISWKIYFSYNIYNFSTQLSLTDTVYVLDVSKVLNTSKAGKEAKNF